MAPASKIVTADRSTQPASAPHVPQGDRPLPVLPGETGVRPSAMSKWRAGVLIGVHVLIAIHISHWLTTGRTVSPIEPSEAMEFTKHGIVNAGVIFFGLAILSTAVFGRFVCGWACHLIALQDLSRWLLGKMGLRPKPFRSRMLVWVPLGTFTYMYLYPLAYRMWIGDDLGYRSSAIITTRFWASFPGLVVAVMTLATCGFAIIYFLGSKGFCNYACPYGGIFQAVDRLAPLRIRVTDACSGCGHCTAVCTSDVRVHQEVRDYGMVVDSKCMKCQDCISVCPNDALYYGFGKPALFVGRVETKTVQRRFDYSWPEELMLAGFFFAGLLVFRGLYGMVPFLFSLGLSSILAYVSVQFVRLAYKPAVTIQRWTLKRAHRVQRGGLTFGVGMSLIWLFWAHSGLVQYHSNFAQRLYGQLELARHDRPAGPGDDGELSDHESVLLERALFHARKAQAWTLSDRMPSAILLARLCQFDGDSDGFERYMRLATSQTPQNANLSLEWGDALAGQGLIDRAVNQWRRAVTLDPDLVAGYTQLGMALTQIGRPEEAADVFETALARHPGVAGLHYNFGVLEASAGRNESAMLRFEQALALEEDFIQARENLAGMLCAMGRFEDGIRHYRAALQTNPDDASTHQLLARAYMATQAWASAKVELEAVLRLDPDRTEAYRLLAQLHASQGDMDAAQHYLRRATQSQPRQ